MRWKLGATMFTVFGALALVVAGIGLYSVIAYNVTQRTHEMGVRVALGAESRDLVRLVLGEGLRLSAVALTLGLAVSLLAGRFIAPLLFETSPRDPLVLAGVAALLLLVSGGRRARCPRCGRRGWIPTGRSGTSERCRPTGRRADRNAEGARVGPPRCIGAVILLAAQSAARTTSSASYPLRR